MHEICKLEFVVIGGMSYDDDTWDIYLIEELQTIMFDFG